MKLDRFYNIACVSAAVLILLPFVLDSLIADIPRWAWNAMTVLIFTSFAAVAVLFLARKVRDGDQKKGWRGRGRKDI